MSDFVILLIVLPLAGAIAPLAAKLPAFARKGRLVRALLLLSVAPLVAGVAALIRLYPTVASGGPLSYTLGGFPVPVGIALEMDGLAWLASLLVYLLSLLIGVFALSHREYRAEFYFFYALLVAGMEGVVLTTDLFNMFVSFEIVAIAAYVLIAYHRDALSLVASFKYLILSSVGIFFFLFGTFIIYRELGTLSLEEISTFYRESTDPSRLRVLRLALTTLVVGIGVRTAFIPFHTWLPEAHAYAPHPISALLSGVLIKISFFAMVRVIHAFDPRLFAHLLLWIGAVTALVAVVWALSQRDVKKLLAYHSISQMGYVLAAIGAAGIAAAAGAGVAGGADAGVTAGAAGGALALSGSVYHAINHGLFKSLLFLAVGTAVHMTGERNVYRMPHLGRRTPLLALLFLVGALSIAGAPGFNGYASKYVISSVLDGSPAYLLLWLTGVGTVASFIKLSRVFWPDAPTGALGRRPRVPGPALAAMGVLAALCVAAGVAPREAAGVLAQLLGGGGVAGVAAAAVPGAAAAAESGLAPAAGAAVGPAAEAVTRAAVGTLKAPFAAAKLAETALVFALGTGVYFVTQSRLGAMATHRIEAVAPRLRAVLLFFLAGLAGFAVVAHFPVGG
ncbi:MAG: complex I subunit 5 family protein [Spirochaetota bacterium]